MHCTFTVCCHHGIDASGRWRLIVTDDNASDTGTLNAWSLRILY